MVFLMICASTMIYRPYSIYAEIFVVPIGVVFSLTSVRANLPGAPVGFGAAIDLYSILPVLVIMALCGCYLLLVILYRRLDKEDTKVGKSGTKTTSEHVSADMPKLKESAEENQRGIDIVYTTDSQSVEEQIGTDCSTVAASVRGDSSSRRD